MLAHGFLIEYSIEKVLEILLGTKAYYNFLVKPKRSDDFVCDQIKTNF